MRPCPVPTNRAFSFLIITIQFSDRIYTGAWAPMKWIFRYEANHDELRRRMMVRFVTEMEPTSFFFASLAFDIENRRISHCRSVRRERCVVFVVVYLLRLPSAHIAQYTQHITCHSKISKAVVVPFLHLFVSKWVMCLCVPFEKLTKKKDRKKSVRNWTIIIRRRASFTVGDKAPRYETLYKSRHYWPRPIRSNLTYLFFLCFGKSVRNGEKMLIRCFARMREIPKEPSMGWYDGK